MFNKKVQTLKSTKLVDEGIWYYIFLREGKRFGVLKQDLFFAFQKGGERQAYLEIDLAWAEFKAKLQKADAYQTFLERIPKSSQTKLDKFLRGN